MGRLGLTPMPLERARFAERAQRATAATIATLALPLMLAAVLVAAAVSAQADAVADFYAGKLIRIVVGFDSGGGYDVYARLLARHMGKHIPGNPSLVVQNMPGAGGLRAANFLYAAAPKDGTTIGTFSRDMPLLAALGGNPGVAFDPRRFTWLGSSSSFSDDAYFLIVRADAPVTSIAEARRPGAPVMILGGSNEGASGSDVPIILRDTLGLNIKLVNGYPDSNAIFLAMERGEIAGRTVDLSTLRSLRPKWLEPGGGTRVLLAFARATRHPDFPDVPTARELAPAGPGRALIELAERPYAMARPFMAPPGLLPERAQALQLAFLATSKDPDYLAEAEKLGLAISPVDSTEVARTVVGIAGADPDVLAHLRRLLADDKRRG